MIVQKDTLAYWIPPNAEFKWMVVQPPRFFRLYKTRWLNTTTGEGFVAFVLFVLWVRVASWRSHV